VHPAYSVILFTTASGAGYGLLIFLALLGAAGLVPITWPIGVAGFGLALALVTTGLLSSTFHLGRPERAWRAFSQWRSSWLSREGVAAVATYIPAGLLALAWVFDGRMTPAVIILAGLATLLALLTVTCTGMIYASLPTIRQWHQPLVTPVYLALALASGALLTLSLLSIADAAPRILAPITAAALALAAALKLLYWRTIDDMPARHTTETATGLGHLGKVQPVIPPHTRANFVMREMGYQVARRHAVRLRNMVLLFGFALPTILVLAMPLLGTPLATGFAILATLSAAFGIVVERWLFFAEAQHVVTLYYGADRA
jgi:DMSO reductase anchor subunit